jgi:thiosulfate dehydrogenase [quinone] large subunit
MEKMAHSKSDLGHTLAMLILRLWLAVRALQTGIEKFAGTGTSSKDVVIDGAPNAYGLSEATTTKAYALSNYQGVPAPLYDKFAGEPLIPAWGLDLYNLILGPALLILGLTLLLGIATRFTLFAMGLLYTSLTFGLILIKQDAGVAWLGIHILIIVAALALANYNRFALLKKW